MSEAPCDLSDDPIYLDPADVPLPAPVLYLQEQSDTISSHLKSVADEWKYCDIVLAVPVNKEDDSMSMSRLTPVKTDKDQKYALFPAVKVLLASRSSVFDGLFTKCSISSEHVELSTIWPDAPKGLSTPMIKTHLEPAFRPQVFKALLDFCHTGASIVPDENILFLLSLHELACYYCVPSLLPHVQEAFRVTLTPSAVPCLLRNRYVTRCASAQELLQLVLEYVDDHVAGVLEYARDFDRISLDRVLRRDTLRVTEEVSLYAAVLQWADAKLKDPQLVIRDKRSGAIIAVRHDEAASDISVDAETTAAMSDAFARDDTDPLTHDDDDSDEYTPMSSHQPPRASRRLAGKAAAPVRAPMSPSSAESDANLLFLIPDRVISVEDWCAEVDKTIEVDFGALHHSLYADTTGMAVKTAAELGSAPAEPMIAGKRTRDAAAAAIAAAKDAEDDRTTKRRRTGASSSSSSASGGMTDVDADPVRLTPLNHSNPMTCYCPAHRPELPQHVNGSLADAAAAAAAADKVASTVLVSHRRAMTILALPLLAQIRFPLLDTRTLSQRVTNDGIVPSWVVIQAMAGQADPSAPKLLPKHMYCPRSFLFRFDISLHTDGEWEVEKQGLTFKNVLSTECSLTTNKPLIRELNDDRVITFEVSLGELSCSQRKGFFGVGLMAQPLIKYKDGVTSKQNGTLYYSNGWISSFGSTLDKSGNVPPYDIGDRVGLQIDLKANTLVFLLNGVPTCNKVTLNSAFLPVGAHIYPAVRLKSRTTATIVSA